MMAARRFPFGNEPAVMKAEQTALLPSPNPQKPNPQKPDPQKTELLADFKPPGSVLPFRAPLLPPAPPHPLVPPLPLRVPGREPLTFRYVATLVLLVLDIAVLLYLAVTWRP
jgi:hypothetical protein